MADIEERLKGHAEAFSGLLSLIPAKLYYAEDNTDQWQRKKQTKEQAREAKRAKLAPEPAKTAKDVLDESARKRKREDGTLDSDSSDGELGSEVPGEGLNRGDKVKKQKPVEQTDADQKAKNEQAEARKKLKQEKQEKKKAVQKEKKKAKDAARKENATSDDKSTDAPAEAPKKDAKKSAKTNGASTEKKVEKAESEDDDDAEDDGVDEGFSLEFNAEPEEQSSVSSTRDSPDASHPQSGSSSISSIVPPTTESKTSEPKTPKSSPDELKQRLQKRLDELRAARHADGLNGKPARNRQELIEARRQKAEQRKAHKKELRQKAREEEQRKEDEAIARRFSPGGSGSLLASPRSPVEPSGGSNNFSFGRVVFADGQHADASLSSFRDKHTSRGPTDAAGQLKVAEAKAARLAEMDPAKRAELEEKDSWLNAKKRAHGERVRDDTSLLKKALKRKETAKKKSEREWRDRIDTVSRMKDQRQTKREENLRKRRDEKKDKGGKSKKPAGGGKKKARPGFEGSFKAKTGGKKK